MFIINIIAWLLFGLIIGALARFVLPGKQDLNMIMTIALGVVGSFVGGGLYSLIFGAEGGWFQPGGWLLSLVGAIIVLLIYTRVAARPAR
ncbi:MAG: GlsB/YeaQ/YmgE family stress response membrane protein [Planctomycetota bacterium]